MKRAGAAGQVNESGSIEESDIGLLAAALTAGEVNNWPELNFLLDPGRLYSYADLIDLILDRVVRSSSPYAHVRNHNDQNLGGSSGGGDGGEGGDGGDGGDGGKDNNHLGEVD